ncbi:DUF1289 domain-containing protein [Ottowia caeni]|uniref:DUF1289 domain-containing protein n=1 Tax=Ottowia caeni TaxID=2870339 RepID=UPI003D707549|nr:DUF1289 domain-containing protein [Ottowia caeni]
MVSGTAPFTDDLDALAAEAQQAWTHGQPLPSPCIRVCRIDAHTGWCEGCFRRLEEIGDWGSRGEAAKWAVWLQVERRRGNDGSR